MIRIHCSALHSIMGSPENEELPKGALSYMEGLARSVVYGIREFTSPQTDKGNAVEEKSIDLLNMFLFTKYSKNEEYRENDFLCGTCDIYDPANKKTIDIKSSFKVSSFPMFPRSAADAMTKGGYDWQGRGYMMLWNTTAHDVAFVMMDTPDDMIPNKDRDNTELHKVSHIQLGYRISITGIVRDPAIDALIERRCRKCIEYFGNLLVDLGIDPDSVEL